VDEIAQGTALTLITGVAGSGKTKLLTPVVAAARRQKIHTVVISRNALRAQETFDSIGADSWVTAARLHQIKNDRPTMVFVDEGALLDTKDWLNIHELAKSPRVQVVSIGDRYQNQPIDRRAAWASVIAGIEAGGKKVVQLAKSYRCRAWEDEAKLLREADPKAIEKARADERIIPAADNVAKQAAKLWQERFAAFGERCIVVTVTNSAAAEVSAEIQRLQHITAETLIARDSFCGVGDIVRTRLNITDENGKKVYNGDIWIVDSINSADGKITLRHTTKSTSGRPLKIDDNGTLVGEPLRVTVDEAYRKQHVELAYTTTTDTSQGDEGDRAITIAEDAMARSRLNTAATRGKLAPIYVVPVDPALLPPQREDAAVKLLRQILSRDDVARTAHEIVGKVSSELAAKKRDGQTMAEDPIDRLFNSIPQAEKPAGPLADAEDEIDALFRRAAEAAEQAKQQEAERAKAQRQAEALPKAEGEAATVNEPDEASNWAQEPDEPDVLPYDYDPYHEYYGDYDDYGVERDEIAVKGRKTAMTGELLADEAVEVDEATELAEASLDWREDQMTLDAAPVAASAEEPEAGEAAEQQENIEREYRGLFFYQKDGAWIADLDKRAEEQQAAYWRKQAADREEAEATKGMSIIEQRNWLLSRSLEAHPDIFDITSRREIEPGSGLFYDPALDPEMVARKAAEEVEAEAYWENARREDAKRGYRPSPYDNNEGESRGGGYGYRPK
jgi:hypothetical protein